MPTRPDEVVAVPFGYMARFGRFISMRGTLSPEEHAEQVAALIASAGDVKRDQANLRAQLLEILQASDSVDLVARASLTYLQMDPDTYKEWESDRSPAHVEYLALQTLGASLPSAERRVHPGEAARLTFDALETVRELFRLTSFLLVIESIKARRDRPGDTTGEYALRARLESLAIRGVGYPEHLERILHGCLDPFDQRCREALGFTASDALVLTYGIADLLSDRVEPRWREAAAGRSELLRGLKKARRRRGRNVGKDDPLYPRWLLDLPPPQARLHIGGLALSWLFADARSLALLTAEELAARCSLEVPACEAFLSAFTCPRELFRPEHHGLPGGPHPLTTRPILQVEGGFILPVGSALIEAIRPRMEDLLREDARVWDRYVEVRSHWLESEAVHLLSSALPGSKAWQGLAWRSSVDGSDLDGLVAGDDIAIRIQCKAGRLTAPARRGAPQRMWRDIGELIEAAAKQHATLDAALKREGAASIGFSDEQSKALTRPLQFEAIVCLDDVVVWATETHKLREVGVLPADRHVPWVLSLMDLMVVVDILGGAELAHYLVRRQRLERDGRVAAHDELDWLGHYLAEGLYFDRHFEGSQAPGQVRLLSYTDAIDAWYFTRAGIREVPAPKPAQEIPSNLAWLVRRLERERPRHWVLAAVALLDGDQRSRNLWDDSIAHMRDRVAGAGWSNASQLFDKRLGVTLYVDMRTPWPAIRFRIADYCRKKAEEVDEANWVGVGEGANGGLQVILVERDPRMTLTAVFLEPPRSLVPGRDPSPGTTDAA